MALAQYPPEWTTFTDPVTQTPVTQWTSAKASHHHFHSGKATVCESTDRGFFVSDRGGIFNVYSISLRTGWISQITDLRNMSPLSPTLSPGQPLIYACDGDRVVEVNWHDGSQREVCRLTDTQPDYCSLSSDGRTLSITASGSDRGGEHVVVDVASGEVKLKVSLPETPGQAGPIPVPTLSARGDIVVFTEERNGYRHVFTAGCR